MHKLSTARMKEGMPNQENPRKPQSFLEKKTPRDTSLHQHQPHQCPTSQSINQHDDDNNTPHRSTPILPSPILSIRSSHNPSTTPPPTTPPQYPTPLHLFFPHHKDPPIAPQNGATPLPRIKSSGPNPCSSSRLGNPPRSDY